MKARFAFPLLFLLLVMSVVCVGQTIYTQTVPYRCNVVGCTNAQFSPTATASWSTGLKYMGGSWANQTFTWNGVTYNDFSGQMKFVHQYPGNPTWLLTGTFGNGQYTFNETFYCFKTCGVDTGVTIVGP